MSNNGNKKPKNYSIIFIVIGAVGIIGTAIFLLSSYRSSKNIQELMRPLVYMFVPFIISFGIFKTGVNGMVNKKK